MTKRHPADPDCLFIGHETLAAIDRLRQLAHLAESTAGTDIAVVSSTNAARFAADLKALLAAYDAGAQP